MSSNLSIKRNKGSKKHPDKEGSAALVNLSSNREYRSTLFTSYFGIPENAAQLYEGMLALKSLNEGIGIFESDGVSLKPCYPEHISPDDIMFATLEGVLYLARKNDLAFTVKNKILVIGEHQSTINQNMPLRSAIYYGRTMEKLIDPKAIYRESRIAIPTPEFFVFYNGKKPRPLEETLYLSDSYLEKTNHPMLQLEVKVINTNPEVNHPLLKECRPLYEYSWFISRIRDYQEEGKNRDEAIALAMDDSIREDIMAEFLKNHGSEVRNMLFTEFNLEDAREVWEEEAREEGRIEGRREGKIEGREEGEDYILIKLTAQKLKKDKTAKTIAEELETDFIKIQEICNIAKDFAPDYDPDAIFNIWKRKNG